MAQWGSKDASSNAVLWAPAQVKLAPNTTNRNSMYGNTTADSFVTGETVGVFAVDAAKENAGKSRLGSVSANAVGTSGSYVPGEVLTIDNTGATAVKNATVIVLSTKIRTVTANSGQGSGYANGDTVTCGSGVMTTNAVFTVTTGASNTSIASLTLTTNGVFSTNPTLTNDVLKNVSVVNASANGGKATYTMRIASLGVNDPGSYSVQPTEANNNSLAGSASGNGATAAFVWNETKVGVAHSGWVLRKIGSGGRAGREFNEVLVAGGITSENTSSNTVFPS